MSEEEAKTGIAKMNAMLKVRPFSEVVMDGKYDAIRRGFDEGPWGVLVDVLEKRNGKIYATVKMVLKDSKEFRKFMEVA